MRRVSETIMIERIKTVRNTLIEKQIDRQRKKRDRQSEMGERVRERE